MEESHHVLSLFEPMVLLAAAVLAVPLAKRAGLGPVLGYIAAGVAIGPFVLGLFGEPERVAGLAELGIVLLLFIIGLELNLGRLWALRRDIFGLGTAQMLGSGGVMALALRFAAGWAWPAAIVAGLGLALSSTALVLPLLEERGEVEAPHGRTAFAILLLQDLAIVPLLALVAFLSPLAVAQQGSAWAAAGTAVAALAAVVLAGRFLLNPLFGLLARSGAREIMTAAALLVVLGAAALMAWAGLSMAMGAFLAGVLLAESNYRHELEADIEPFRGLLLGLFFLSVGMGLDLGVIAARWPVLLAGVLALVLLKLGTTYAVARLFGHPPEVALRAALLLAQGGEFGFVLYGTAAVAGVLAPEQASLLTALVTLSMATTPLVIRFGPALLRRCGQDIPDEDYSEAHGSVLMIGFGRFGQLVTQVLQRQGVAVTLLDNDPRRIEEAARFGARVFYGDGTRLDVLRAAGAERARLILVCTDRPETTSRVLAIVREALPEIPCHARAFDRPHALALLKVGAASVMRETLESALAFGREALVGLGLSRDEAEEVEAEVRRLDRERFKAQRLHGAVTPQDLFTMRPEPLTPRRGTAAPAEGQAVAD
ncbi:monovalent cation:proton antiporter-2 (CPA2) family protein [Pseudoroseomonas globiformis]|uniref:Monovalent cation:proton antiporter-2 (CPA2) family protein n=1 Tax=Teichococcus globiformis TaxID=2307229 RepID=A0ABV7FXB1_9PROT